MRRADRAPGSDHLKWMGPQQRVALLQQDRALWRPAAASPGLHPGAFLLLFFLLWEVAAALLGPAPALEDVGSPEGACVYTGVCAGGIMGGRGYVCVGWARGE